MVLRGIYKATLIPLTDVFRFRFRHYSPKAPDNANLGLAVVGMYHLET